MTQNKQKTQANLAKDDWVDMARIKWMRRGNMAIQVHSKDPPLNAGKNCKDEAPCYMYPTKRMNQPNNARVRWSKPHK